MSEQDDSLIDINLPSKPEIDQHAEDSENNKEGVPANVDLEDEVPPPPALLQPETPVSVKKTTFGEEFAALAARSSRASRSSSRTGRPDAAAVGTGAAGPVNTTSDAGEAADDAFGDSEDEVLEGGIHLSTEGNSTSNNGYVADIDLALKQSYMHVEIIGTSTEEVSAPSPSKFTVYEVLFECGDQKWILKKRYSDFLHLFGDLEVRHAREIQNLPAFPSKTIPLLGPDPLDPSVVANRRAGLEKFIQVAASSPEIFSSPSFQAFVRPHDDGNSYNNGGPASLDRRLQTGATVVSEDNGSSADTMRACVLRDYGGGPDQLEVTVLPKPFYSPTMMQNMVMVEVWAASVSPMDCSVRLGDYRSLLPYQLPIVMGLDFSGVVCAVPDGGELGRASAFKLGDQVFGRVRETCPGTFAEYLVVHIDEIALKPTSISHEEAASLPTAALATHQALVNVGRLTAGQSLLITGAAGGVGSLAVQYASRVLGARVTATCTPEKAEIAEKLGADTVYNYRDVDIKLTVKNQDLVFDLVAAGADLFSCLKPGSGRLVSISNPSPTGVSVKDAFFPCPFWYRLVLDSLNVLMYSQAKLKDVKYDYVWTKPSGKVLKEIARLVDDGKIVAVIDRVYPLDRVASALDYVAQGHASGKVVIAIKMQ